MVTANKALLAEDGAALAEAADASGVDLYYEAVGGRGDPAAAAAARVAGRRPDHPGGRHRQRHHQLHPVRDGRDGSSYADALEEATRLGYAEADPSADVDGYDAASKAAILASLAFHTRVTAADVYCEGIRQVTAADIAAATGSAA